MRTPLHPAALASVPYGIVLVRVRVWLPGLCRVAACLRLCEVTVKLLGAILPLPEGYGPPAACVRLRATAAAAFISLVCLSALGFLARARRCSRSRIYSLAPSRNNSHQAPSTSVRPPNTEPDLPVQAMVRCLRLARREGDEPGTYPFSVARGSRGLWLERLI